MADAELEVLSRTLRRTLTSLQNKRDYLLEQQHNYIGIRGKLLLLLKGSYGRGTADELSLENVDTLRGVGNEGLVFKDVVITDGKCYLNIGYEYYVEKGIEECLQVVDDKLVSIEDALVQFDKKIGEANDTMRNMSVFEDGNGELKKGSRKIEEEEQESEEEEEEEYQIMEIREELDDEGNVISSSVRPKPTEKDIEKLHESMVEGMKRTTHPPPPSGTLQTGNDDTGGASVGDDDFKKNLRGKLLSNKEHKKRASRDETSIPGINKVDRTGNPKSIEEISSDNNVSKNRDNGIKKEEGSVTEVATDNIYTFDDLVRQLDEQDELEDGKIEEADIDYSMERFDWNNTIAKNEDKEVDEDDNTNDTDQDDEDEDEDLDSQRYSIVPNSAGRLSFLDQINKLRSPKIQKEASKATQKSVPVTEKSSQLAPPKKSILKKTTVNEKSNERKDTEPKKEDKKETKEKKKKNVGFAETLDIYEVENLKEDTKRQTANFPRVPLMAPTTPSNEDENGFDSDLFAQLIGARNPDELHDKYQEKIREIQAKEDAHLEESRGRRVSRFKKERHANEDDESALLNDKTDSSESHDKGSSGRAVMDIVEHQLEPEPEPKAQTPAITGKRVSKFAQRLGSRQATATAPAATTTTHEPFVVKEMRSLQRPRTNNSGGSKNSNAQLISKKILEELSDSNGSSDEDNNDDQDRIPVKPADNKTASQEARIKEKLEKTGDQFEFPEEIKKILKERGKDKDSVHVANVDYSGLNDNLDDMARAYTLGLYDDDLEEHPGTLVEKLDDFKSYNKQVDELKDEIDSFRRENPLLREVEDGDDNRDGPIMVDVVEHDLPEDYARDIMEDDDNYALNPDKLGEEVRRSYFEKREYMIQKLKKMSKENGVVKDIQEEPTGPIILPSEEIEEHELEPIDESGNPVKISKFKAKRMNLRL